MALGIPAVRASDRQFLVTVLRSSDPQQVGELLALQPAPDRPALKREMRTGGYERETAGRWQVIVQEGRPAGVVTGMAVPRLRIPLVELTRHGPLPRVVPEWADYMQGERVQVRRVSGGVEVQLDRVGGDAGAGLTTVVRGRFGQWLDAGGTLVPWGVVPGARHSGARRGDPRLFRILVRVDSTD